jgi:hypothetical protein
MADSIMDFSKTMQVMASFGQLAEARRRNDIAEEGSILELGRLKVAQERNALDQTKVKFDMTAKAFDEIEKLSKHPAFALNPARQIDLRFAQANLIKHGLNVNMPIPSREELIGSYEQYGSLLKSIRSGTADERRDALEQMLVAAPEFGKKVLDELKTAGELDAQSEQLAMKLELDRVRLKQINLKSGQLKLQQGMLTEHIGALSETLNIGEKTEFEKNYREVSMLEKPNARAAYLNLHPEFKKAFNEAITARQTQSLNSLSELRDVLASKEDAIKIAQDRYGLAPDELVEETKTLRAVVQARDSESRYFLDPYDKNNLRDVQKNMQVLRTFYGVGEKKIAGMDQEKLNFMQSKFSDLQKEKLATNYAQEKFLEYLEGGMSDNQAGLIAMKDASKKYPGVAIDSKDMKNLNKVGKQEIGIKMGQEDVSRNMKAIESAQHVIDYAHELKDRIEKNPSIIGKGANFATALAGSLQQLRAVAGSDPAGTKFLNTQTRDEAEAFYEILVYLQARSMDPSGALDLKVVEHARKVLGDMNSITTGPAQMLNKLSTVTGAAEKNIRSARRNLQLGVKAYMEDDNRKASELTAEELMRALMKEVGK